MKWAALLAFAWFGCGGRPTPSRVLVPTPPLDPSGTKAATPTPKGCPVPLPGPAPVSVLASGRNDDVSQTILSRDGSRAYLRAAQGIEVWDVARGEPLGFVSKGARSMLLAPDESFLVASTTKKPFVISLPSGALQEIDHEGKVIQVLSDGRVLLSSSRGLLLWRKGMQAPEAYSNVVVQVPERIGGDGSVALDQMFQLRELPSGKLLRALPRDQWGEFSMSRRGHVAAVLVQDKGLVIDVHTGETKIHWAKRPQKIFLNDAGTYAVVLDAEAGASVWDVLAGKKAWDAVGGCQAPVFSQDGEHVVIPCTDSQLLFRLEVFELRTGRKEPGCVSRNGWPVAFSGTTKTLLLRGENHEFLSCTERKEGPRFRVAKNASESAQWAILSPDRHRLAMLHTDVVDREATWTLRTLRIDDGAVEGVLSLTHAGSEQQVKPRSGGSVARERGVFLSHAVWSRGGDRLHVASELGILEWDGKAKKPVRVLDAEERARDRIVAVSGERLVSAIKGRPDVRIWNLESSEMVRKIATPTVRSLAFRSDGKRLAVGLDPLPEGSVAERSYSILLLDAESGREVRRIQTAGPVGRLAYGPSGIALVGQVGTHVSIFVATDEEPGRATDVPKPLVPSDWTYHPDGNRLAVSEPSGIYLVDLRSGTPQLLSDRPGTGLMFDPTGEFLLWVEAGTIQWLRLFDRSKLMLFQGGHDAWMGVSDAGLYSGDPAAFDLVRFGVGPGPIANEVRTASQMHDRFRANLLRDFVHGCALTANAVRGAL